MCLFLVSLYSNSTAKDLPGIGGDSLRGPRKSTSSRRKAEE
jgi:hypothetical protein